MSKVTLELTKEELEALRVAIKTRLLGVNRSIQSAATDGVREEWEAFARKLKSVVRKIEILRKR